MMLKKIGHFLRHRASRKSQFIRLARFHAHPAEIIRQITDPARELPEKEAGMDFIAFAKAVGIQVFFTFPDRSVLMPDYNLLHTSFSNDIN
jgi:hypothetical protein